MDPKNQKQPLKTDVGQIMTGYIIGSLIGSLILKRRKAKQEKIEKAKAEAEKEIWKYEKIDDEPKIPKSN
ncbi:MAG: hypothetical protein Q8P07_05435 [bacterium]|nr:hypothetical protein [bacterium]